MTDLERYEQRSTGPAGELVEWAQAAKAAHELAKGLTATTFAPDQFRNKPLEAMAAIVAGAEVGLSPMQALQSTYVIGGRPAYYARVMVALTQRQGHDVWTEKETPAGVTVCGQRSGSETVERVTVTMDDARRAGWTRNKQYDSNPTDMLWARAASRVCRRIAADALLGIPYSVEELQDAEAEPEPVRKVSRRRQPVPALDVPAIEADPETPVGRGAGSADPPAPPDNDDDGGVLVEWPEPATPPDAA